MAAPGYLTHKRMLPVIFWTKQAVARSGQLDSGLTSIAQRVRSNLVCDGSGEEFDSDTSNNGTHGGRST